MQGMIKCPNPLPKISAQIGISRNALFLYTISFPANVFPLFPPNRKLRVLVTFSIVNSTRLSIFLRIGNRIIFEVKSSMSKITKIRNHLQLITINFVYIFISYKRYFCMKNIHIF